MNDNYPDNIRDFDHCPQSPFYDDGGKDQALEEMINDWDNELNIIASSNFKDIKEFQHDLLLEIVTFMQDNDTLTFEQAMTAMAEQEFERNI